MRGVPVLKLRGRNLSDNDLLVRDPEKHEYYYRYKKKHNHDAKTAVAARVDGV